MTAHSAVISLKQDLELLRTSSHLSVSTLGKGKYDELYNKANLVDWLLRDALRESELQSRIRNVLVSVKNGLEILIHKELFEKFHGDVRLMDSLLTETLRESYFQSEVRGEMVSIKDIVEDLEPVFNNKEFHKLYDDINSMDSLLTNSSGESCSQSRIRDVVASMKKDLEPSFRKVEFQIIYENISLMDSLMKDYSGESCNREMTVEFQNRIRDVANKAANYLRLEVHLEVFVNFGASHIATIDKGRAASVDPSFRRSTLCEITEEIVSLKDELAKKIHELREENEIAITQNSGSVSSNTDDFLTLSNPSQKSRNKDGKLVGLDEDLKVMSGCLTQRPSNIKVFSVIGMAGIGKTTFVKELYNHPLVMGYFDVRAWATVSQGYKLKRLLLDVLDCVTNLSDENHKMDDEQLKQQLYQSLKWRRYLIVLDDVWNIEVWNSLSTYFPEDNKGSKVLFTTRLKDVAIHASPSIHHHYLQFLTPEESWDLLCSKIFPIGSCPVELLNIGKEIARKCHGLPLALVLVGGLLSKVNKTLEVWGEVALNVGSLVMDDPQHYQNILALSYNHLSAPLKACLLCMGIFPEDHEIFSRKLMFLWIVEGFVQPKEQKLLEEVAEDYLEDLVARSVVMVGKRRSNGGIKSCYLHDLMRDFCLRESEKENFLGIFHNCGDNLKYCTEFLEKHQHNLPRLALYTNLHVFMKNISSLPFTRSFFCFEALRSIDIKDYPGIRFRLLKILDIMHVHIPSLPSGILHLTTLKFLAATIQESVLLSDLSKLQSLQTCIIDCEFSGLLPREFWDMTELRHIHLKRRSSVSHGLFVFSGYELSACTVLQNLQSLSTIGPFCCTEEFFRHMPNLRKLGVYATEEDCEFLDWFNNLAFLRNLEVLKYGFSNPFTDLGVKPKLLPSSEYFPQSLIKLTLSGTSFPWEDMVKLSLLPKLEVLKLRNYAFSGEFWNLEDLEESRFKCLKFLMIGSTNLKVWEADGCPFPKLEHLVLRHCRSLTSIPSSLGEAAPSLNKIELHSCRASVADSARQFQEEEQDLGNESLTVYITGDENLVALGIDSYALPGGSVAGTSNTRSNLEDEDWYGYDSDDDDQVEEED